MKGLIYASSNIKFESKFHSEMSYNIGFRKHPIAKIERSKELMKTPGEKSQPPVLSIVGRSGVGKTTLLEKLIPELKERGYRVGTVKHHAHTGFEIDHPGKDTWRHAQAGSDHVVIAAPDRIAAIQHIDHEWSIQEIVATMKDVDIVLTEGFRRADTLKIEVLRAEISQEAICCPEELLALMADFVPVTSVPYFDINDACGLASLIEKQFLQPGEHSGLNQ